jgi:hypothetical protein
VFSFFICRLLELTESPGVGAAFVGARSVGRALGVDFAKNSIELYVQREPPATTGGAAAGADGV